MFKKELLVHVLGLSTYQISFTSKFQQQNRISVFDGHCQRLMKMMPSCGLTGTKPWRLIARVSPMRTRASVGGNRLLQRIAVSSISSNDRTGKRNRGYYLYQSRAISSVSSKRTRQQVQDQILTALESKELQLSSSAEWSVNPYELERHGHGESYHPTEIPDIVLSPSCVDDVSKVLKYCNDHSIPVVPFGAGTSVEGHVCCLYGGVSLDMSKLQSIKIPGDGVNEYDDDYDDAETAEDHSLGDPIAVVGSGVTRKSLNEALRHTGLQFVVDPGANATIGGMVATGASGTTAVRYGTMKDNVMGSECVLADGTVIRTGTRSLKNSAGYDLTSLMVGSEGTLGVVTSVTVKLHPVADNVMAATVVFDDLYNAADCVAMIKLSDIPVVRCELLDASSVKAFNSWEMNRQTDQNDKEGGSKRTALEEKPTLFLEFQAPSVISLEDQVKQTEAIAKDFGGYNFVHKAEENERRALWAARHDLYYAAIQSRPGNTANASNTVVTDACVPLSKFASVVDATARDVEERGVYGLLFGHCGDGNFHVILPLMPTDSDDYIAQVHEINDNLIRRTLQVGGSCTGEHGVGYGKIKYLTEQYGTGTVSAMKLVKHAFDPKGIMNPGKIVG